MVTTPSPKRVMFRPAGGIQISEIAARGSNRSNGLTRTVTALGQHLNTRERLTLPGFEAVIAAIEEQANPERRVQKFSAIFIIQ